MVLSPILSRNLSSLMWLDLSFNKLSVIDLTHFASFPSLSLLNLDNNRIVAVSRCCCCSLLLTAAHCCSLFLLLLLLLTAAAAAAAAAAAPHCC